MSGSTGTPGFRKQRKSAIVNAELRAGEFEETAYGRRRVRRFGGAGGAIARLAAAARGWFTRGRG